ncbi:hypothetical protein [Streptomyces sp. 8ZJF_21]|nr:hypothetical protein [Streptomyces sp. 8ZJF_21]MCD9592591.1 hypothetical protein [Streptomyces sp. 8ZJF_21]
MVVEPRSAGGNGGPAQAAELAALESVGQRVLWLSTAIIDHANRGTSA